MMLYSVLDSEMQEVCWLKVFLSANIITHKTTNHPKYEQTITNSKIGIDNLVENGKGVNSQCRMVIGRINGSEPPPPRYFFPISHFPASHPIPTQPPNPTRPPPSHPTYPVTHQLTTQSSPPSIPPKSRLVRGVPYHRAMRHPAQTRARKAAARVTGVRRWLTAWQSTHGKHGMGNPHKPARLTVWGRRKSPRPGPRKCTQTPLILRSVRVARTC